MNTKRSSNPDEGSNPSMGSKTPQEMYNVDVYSDEELMNILDLFHPTDRELEMKIVHFIRKYDLIGNDEGDRFATFFRKIYHRFFDISLLEEEDDVEEEEDDVEEEEDDSVEGFVTSDPNITLSNSKRSNNPTEGSKQLNLDTTSSNYEVKGNVISSDGKEKVQASPELQLTSTFNYTKGKLNPLLKETVKRIITIDSQYRDSKQAVSTNFTLNFNETLKDVVSLKLYAVQIPYNWYTISQSYGSNFLYIKGNSQGIDDGYHDFKISIPPGNYNQTTLTTAVQLSLTNLVSIYPDVSFGSTQLIYNQTSCLATYQIDIQNAFNESNYRFYFDGPFYSPIVINNNFSSNRNYHLGSFLGFNYTDYSLSSVYSSRNITSVTGFPDANTSKYSFDLSNSTIQLFQYAGPGELASNSIIYQIYTISFPITGINQSQNLIFQAVNNVLSMDTRFVNASVSFVQISGMDVCGNTIDSSGNYRFEWNLKLNRKLGNNIPGSKFCLVLPQENNTVNPIWVGPKSCFYFDQSYNEVNNLISETYVSSSAFDISGNVYYSFELADTAYNVGNVNDLSYAIPNFNGYSLNNYLDAINLGFSKMNTAFSSKNNNNPIFIPGYNSVFIDNQSYVNVKIDMARYFYTENFVIDISGTFFYNTLGFDKNDINTTVDLSENMTFIGIFPQQANYSILDTDTLLMTISGNPKNTNGISSSLSDISYNVYINPGTYNGYFALQNEINRAFRSYSEPRHPSSNPLKYMSVIMDPSLNNQLQCILMVDIEKQILEDEYILYFHDKSWKQNLYLDFSYNLGNYSSFESNVAIIIGDSPVSIDTIILDGSGGFFHLSPLDIPSGDISFCIPPAVYTRTQLFNIMNTLFSENPVTAGTQIYAISVGGVEYTKIRWNINKVYTTSDYKLVFYDLFSFVSSYLGNLSVKNTTWDTTLGWITGFRALTTYPLTAANVYRDVNSGNTYYIDNGEKYHTLSPYIFTSDISYRNIAYLTGDTTVSVNLYNYFMVILDDYNQNHLNDGLVTIAPVDNMVNLPSYANRKTVVLDQDSGLVLNVGITEPASNQLTKNQLYSLNQIIQTQNTPKSFTNSGVFVKDIFGLIPIKTAGMKPGDTYVELGGTLQNQDRIYFGPINIHRMGIKLMNDRGDIVDLNGANWSLQFICEQLYQTTLPNNAGGDDKKK